jgi:chemotaxis receptor (MCP) glutamine deamidase CheD
MELKQGDTAVTRNGSLSCYLQTCCGVLLFDRSGLIGMSHSIIPHEYSEWYIKGMPEDAEFRSSYVTRLAIKELVSKMNENHAGSLSAIVAGCQTGGDLGKKNLAEALDTLAREKIRFHDYVAQLPYDIKFEARPNNARISLVRDQMTLREMDFTL